MFVKKQEPKPSKIQMNKFNLSKQAMVNHQPIYKSVNPFIDIIGNQDLYIMSNPLTDIWL
jgi:hypothetical protein